MASQCIETYSRTLPFPIGALVLSKGIDRLVRTGHLDPIPYFRRHCRGDWGDVSDEHWHANVAALQAGSELKSLYVVHAELSIRICTDADRTTTYIVLPSEH